MTLTYRRQGNILVPDSAPVCEDRMPAGVYRPQQTGMQWGFAPNPIAADKLIRVKDDISDLIISEIIDFWAMRERFTKFGYLHKRGWLLYGGPGCGKSSTIAMTCDELSKKDAIIYFADHGPGLATSQIRSIRQRESDRNILVVMEDLDQVLRDHEEESVLALLDGHQTFNGVAFVATTNYIDQLSSRVKNRPSRFDRVIDIGMPTAEFRFQYLKTKNLDLPEETLRKWAEETTGMSVAHLKELIVGVCVMERPYSEVLARVKAMYEAEKNQTNED